MQEVDTLVKNEIIRQLNNSLPVYLKDISSLFIRENTGMEDSIIACAASSVYRPGISTECVFCWVKLRGKTHYVSFPFKNKDTLDRLQLPYTVNTRTKI